MSDEQIINGNASKPVVQLIKYGALVEVNKHVKNHGILVVGENMEAFKIFLKIEDGNLKGYHFEDVRAESDNVTHFELMQVCDV